MRRPLAGSLFLSLTAWPAILGAAIQIGKYAGEFMATGVGARPLGMGGAYVAVAADVWGGYWNPAGLAALNYPELSYMHGEQFAGVVNFDYAGVALPYGPRHSLGLTITRVGVDDIPVTALPNADLKLGEVYVDDNGQLRRNVPYIARTISDAEWATYLSFAKVLGEWAWGASTKFVYKALGDHSAWGLGFDVGLRGKTVGDVVLGAIVQDVTTTLLSWDTGRRELIVPTLKMGIAKDWRLRFGDLRFLPTADVDVRFEGRKYAAQAHLGPMSFDTHLGAEVEARNLFAVRVGSDVGHLTLGLGIHLPRLDVDYAFLSHGYLGATHRVSLRFCLEEARLARRE
ncbi:MAG: hypothetical protein ONB23_01155 [candidate division KSB1 bacterium]|nr:hypothetical protein [candidate division KSB1 bacterium]